MFQEQIVDILMAHVPLKKEQLLGLIEVPPDTALGDYAFPCFILAKEMKKAPAQIATELAEKIPKEGIIKDVKAAGPYVNFFLTQTLFVEVAFNPVTFPKTGKTVGVEYSSPNIAKPFGIGHLRSTAIGAALKRIYAFAGWKTISFNHLGDWGTQFGKLIAAYKRWPIELGEDPIKQLFELYVKFHAEAEKDPELETEGRKEFAKLEQGDAENKKLWQQFRDLSMKKFERMYERMHVSFDFAHGESFYEDKMQAVVDELKKKDLLEESEGAQIVNLEDEGIQTPALIIKSDGSTIYTTRDLAQIIFRLNTYDPDRLLYEVGNEQTLHFKQVFAIIKKMGYAHDRLFHVSHGLYRFPEGKMSTRKGKTIFVEDVFNQAVKRTMATITEKNPDLKNKEAVAEMVGVGAIIFNDLKNDRNNDIMFNWEEILDFEGESGPYLQYTHARLRSILRKSSEKPKAEPKLLDTPEEIAVAKGLLAFPEVILKITQSNKPHSLARYLLDLAQLMNSSYQKHRIIQEDKKLEQARLALIEAVAERIKLGLSLLGISAPEEM